MNQLPQGEQGKAGKPADSPDEQDQPATPKAFLVWKFDGLQFMAANTGQNYWIADENGGNYGTWDNVDKFRKRQQDKDEICQPFKQTRLVLRCMAINT